VVKVIAVSGSLRRASSNSAVIEAAALFAPPEVSLDVYAGLASLPHFNPDDDRDPLPPAVAELRAAFGSADAVLVCSPEYAHGVPGALKNALDWMVSSGELMNKPVALVNASPHSRHAHASLAETLTVMMAVVVPEASVTLPLTRNTITAAEIAADPGLADRLREVLAALARAVLHQG
jgi:NAD(P)H-dependent FMN reductase